MRALGDLDGEEDALLPRIDLGPLYARLHVPGVRVKLLDESQVAQEHRLRILARPVEPARRERIPLPGLRREADREIVVVERFVALEDDLAELQLLALFDVEVDRDRAVGDLLDLIGDFGEVVPLGLVDRGHALLILAEEREVERHPRRERQRFLDVVAIDVVVAGDRDLANHGALGDIVDQAPAVGQRLSEHAHVLEEALGEDRAQVPSDLRSVRWKPDRRAQPGPDRFLFDAAVAANHDLGDRIAGRLLRPAREDPIRADDLIHEDHTVVGLPGARDDVRDAGIVGDRPAIRLQRRRVETCPAPQRQDRAKGFFERPGAFEANVDDALGLSAAERRGDLVRELAESIE